MNNHLRSISSTVTAVAFSVLAMPALANVGGFVDAQIYSAGQNDTGNSPTFRVADGAVYLSKELGKGKVMVDVPFKYSGTGTNADFSVGGSKAQAYVSFGYDFGLNWTLGQFDTPYGLEVNDSVGNTLSGTSQVFGALPTTHTGLMLGWGANGFDLKMLVANANGQGLRNGDNFTYGAVAKYTADAFWASAGYLHQKPAGGTESSMLVDLMAGTKFSIVSLDLEGILKKAAVAGADTGVGIMSMITIAPNKTWSFAIRPEYLSKVTVHSEFAVGAGPQCNLTDDLRVKLDWKMVSTTLVSGATSSSNHEATLAAVYKW